MLWYNTDEKDVCDSGFFAAAAFGAFADGMKEALQPYVDSGELPGAISILYDNGREETVKSLLAASSRPANLGGYSLGLNAPVTDGENEWFGHGGAFGTNCSVNWHKKQLKLWVVQLNGYPRPLDQARDKAADEFFATKIDNSGIEAYTGRME